MSAIDKAAGRVLLPDIVVPNRYELRLAPDLERFVFDGHERIRVDVNEATSDVTLHAKELQISAASFTQSEGPGEATAIDVEVIAYNLKHKTVTLTFPEVLPVGPGIIEISFVGSLNDQMAGFYRSSYKDIHGVSKIMASTQFESIDARRCFPCWDEPSRKAVFSVTLVIDPSLIAFSNMPETSSQLVKVRSKYMKELVFMDSPKMSTYLLALVVGEFDFVQAMTEHGVLIRVYTPPGRSQAGTFALGIAQRCLDLYDEFFGVPYPLPKLDMVAIPEFAAGAMENWGLVTYREVDLLIDQKTASNTQKQRVTIVVTHELAHQWFGNLVTMAWWDDLWLNEGFASWCENYAADVIFPDYGMWDQFASDTLASAMRLDSLKTSHPIQVPIHAAEEVEEVFDAISYCKGASVIRMAHSVLGHEVFKKGLQEYMKKHQYMNTETFDLWAAWTEASSKPVKDIMSSWTEQMGFPLLLVKEFSIDGSVGKLSLAQSWFLASGEDPPEERVWSTPIFLRTRKEPSKPVVMMNTQTMEVEVSLSADINAEFVLINQGMKTPMRVAYTADMRESLARAIRSGAIPSVDRVMLLMDAYALAQAGKLGMDEMLRFLANYCGEKEYVVWDALSQILLGLQKLLMGGGSVEVYKWFMDFAEGFVWRGWQTADPGWVARPSDGHRGGLLRGLLVKLVSRFASGPSFLAEATHRFTKYVEDPQGNADHLPDEYRVPIFQAILQHGGECECAQLRHTFKKLTTNVDQKHVFLSIGFSSHSPLKTDALRWAISGEIKIQDFFYVFHSVSQSSKEGLDLTWQFLKAEFDTIWGMVKTASPSIMDAVIEYSTSGYCTDAAADEIEQFFATRPLPQCKRKISQVLEKVRNSARTHEKALASDLRNAEFWDKLNKALTEPPSNSV